MKAKKVFEKLDMLISKSDVEILDNIKNLSPKVILIKSAKYGFASGVKSALEKGANVHAMNDEALKWASRNGHVEVVKILLDAGADIHAGDDYALRYASKNGHTEVVKILKKYSK